MHDPGTRTPSKSVLAWIAEALVNGGYSTRDDAGRVVLTAQVARVARHRVIVAGR